MKVPKDFDECKYDEISNAYNLLSFEGVEEMLSMESKMRSARERLTKCKEIAHHMMKLDLLTHENLTIFSQFMKAALGALSSSIKKSPGFHVREVETLLFSENRQSKFDQAVRVIYLTLHCLQLGI